MEKEEEEEAVAPMVKLGSYGGEVRLMVGGEESTPGETMLLWGIQQPTLSKPNAFASQSSMQLSLNTCGHYLYSSIPFFLGILLPDPSRFS